MPGSVHVCKNTLQSTSDLIGIVKREVTWSELKPSATTDGDYTRAVIASCRAEVLTSGDLDRAT
jgi:hypothetical protein